MGNASRDVIVSVADSQLPEVVARLRAAGMTIDDVLDALGVVTGSVDEAGVAALQRVSGVLDVEIARGYRLPAEPR
ncbi:hypothetical protein SAMN05421810_109223 [Amycolatopsis arida]|uniref:Ketohydroxyglutarate aldolase n=1 Tax=Amycolatopsis arida TaxID=587909 RepID=A0A1I5ZI95_9PSEU|nr:hypothetical protein [Amycolatopsis arida]TDX89702.1 hypothetical protein CLV69_109223 [Amycolatopsis arida]SFQ56155.1 hypothetical protein SAMN05421810_109223 [Amycolatopsis arida]